MEGLLVGGNIPDMVVAHELTDNIVGCYVVEDKGYDSNKNWQNLIANNTIPIIPSRKNRKEKIDKTLYTLCKRIDIFFGKLKENIRLVMRYEKLDVTFLALIAYAAIKINLNLW